MLVEKFNKIQMFLLYLVDEGLVGFLLSHLIRKYLQNTFLIIST